MEMFKPMNKEYGIFESEINEMCTNCEEKIKKIVWRSNNSLYSMYIYFHCLHCQDITLCLPCFSCGAEIGPHKRIHDYKEYIFTRSEVFASVLLDALEEWVSEDTEKYIGIKRLVLGWDDVADEVKYENIEDVKREYFNTFVDGHLGQTIRKLVHKYLGFTQVVTLDKALEMGCIDDCPSYFPPSKYLTVPEDTEKLEDYTIHIELRSDQFMTIKNKKNFDSYQAQLLLQCIGEFGYGNWEDISIQYNRTINEEYYKGNRAYLSVKEIKEEYLRRFIFDPLLRGTWSPLSVDRPLVPDRTTRIEGPSSNYEQLLETQLSYDDLDLFFYPPSLDEDDDDEETTFDEEKVNSKMLSKSQKESLVCVYCLEEFAVTSYRTYNNSGANFKSFSVYVYCTNKQTCKDIYLCLECFSCGAEIGKHRRNHGYKLITELNRFSGDVRVPGSKWTSGELLALLTALEEWFGDSSDKLIDPINPDSLINNWNSVSQYVRSKSADEAKTEFENLILNQKNWIFNEKYVCSNSSYVMTYMDVVQMGCFEDIDVKSTNDKSTSIAAEITEQEKDIWTESDLKLFLEYTAIFGYGNWEKIAKEMNKTNYYEYFFDKVDSIIRIPETLKKKYIHQFLTPSIIRGTWKQLNKKKLIIIDKTQSYCQPIDMLYPVVDCNLFSTIGYNHPYMDSFESDFDSSLQLYCSVFFKENEKLEFNETANIEEMLDKLTSSKTNDDINAIIIFERYNEMLRKRNEVEKIVHSYRLIEQFAMHVELQLPNIKPFSEQNTLERLVKMARVTTVDDHKTLILGLKNEVLLMQRLNELFIYGMIGFTKLSAIDALNSLQKHRSSIKLPTHPGYPTSLGLLMYSEADKKNLGKYILYMRSKLDKFQLGQNLSRLPYIINAECEELLTNTEKTLCHKYNLNPNYYLNRKFDVLKNGLQKDSSKIDHVIYKYLVNVNKIDIPSSNLMLL